MEGSLRSFDRGVDRAFRWLCVCVGGALFRTLQRLLACVCHAPTMRSGGLLREHVRRPPTRPKRARSAPPAPYGTGTLAAVMACGDASKTGASRPLDGSGHTCTCGAEYLPRRLVPRSFSGHDVHNTRPAARTARTPGYVRMSPTGRVCRACHACRASRSDGSVSSYARKGRFLLVCDAAKPKTAAPLAEPPDAQREKRHSAPSRVDAVLSRAAVAPPPRHASVADAYAARFSYVVRHALKCGILAPMQGAWADSLGITGTREDEHWGSDQYWREALLGMPMNDLDEAGRATKTAFVELIGPDGLAQFALLLDAYCERQAKPQRTADAAFARASASADEAGGCVWEGTRDTSNRLAAIGPMPARVVVALLLHIAYLLCHDEPRPGLFFAFAFDHSAAEWCKTMQPALFLRLLTSPLFTACGARLERIDRMARWCAKSGQLGSEMFQRVRMYDV